MKLILLLLFIISAFVSQSQGSYNYYYDYDYDIQSLNNNPLQEDMKGMVKEVRIKNTNFKKKKYNSSIQKQYNDNGLVVYSEANDVKGQLKFKQEIIYNSKGNVSNYKRYTQKGIEKERTVSFDEKLRRIETVKKNKKGKITNRSTWKFANDEDDCAIQSTAYNGGGKKVKRVWDYTYYTGCDLQKTTISNGKGKVIKTWSYDCKKEGEQLTKRKDETQVCKWEESDGKYLIKVFQYFDEKGKIRKTVQKFTLADTLILESTTYDGDDKIKSKYTYDKSFDRLTSYNYFNKKGASRFQRENVYENGLIQSSSYSKKGKKRSATNYSYNDKNWLTKIEKFNSKGEKYKMEEFEYIL